MTMKALFIDFHLLVSNLNRTRNIVMSSENNVELKRKCPCWGWESRSEEVRDLHCGCECTLVQPLRRTVWRVLRKLNTERPDDPASPLLGSCLDKPFLEKDTCTLVFTAALFTIAKTWKQPKCPSVGEWIKKMWYVHNGILLSHQKE